MWLCTSATEVRCSLDASQPVVAHTDCLIAGTIRFLGNVHYAKGDWVGVSLDNGGGKNNGTIKGQTYFECEDGCGIIVRPAEVEPVGRQLFS